MKKAKLTVHEHAERGAPSKKRTVSVSSESVTVGSHDAADIKLSSPDKSFTMEIKFSDGDWWILNPLRSSLITVNGKPVALERRLLSGDEIRAVDHLIGFESILQKQKNLPPLGPIPASDAELWKYLLECNEFDEILINGPSKIFVDWKGSLYETPYQFSASDFLIEKILRASKASGPWASWRLDRRLRFQAILPPAVQEPHLSIRKAKKFALDFEEIETQRFGTPDQMDFLLRAIQERQNILIAGGTSTGKTVLLRALIQKIPAEQRVVILEEEAEIDWPHPHLVPIECGRGNLNEALIETLRLRPDRLIVSEVRGSEALEMLQAMNTGHSGSMTTIHANSTRDALLRLESLVLTANSSLGVPAVRRMIAHAIQIVVQLERDEEGRRHIQQISRISGMQNETILFSDPLKIEPRGIKQRSLPGGEDSH